MMKEDDEYEDYSKKNKEDKKYIAILKRQLWNCRFEGGNMAKKKTPKKGYYKVKRNIDFSHVRKHQRHTSKRKTKK